MTEKLPTPKQVVRTIITKLGNSGVPVATTPELLNLHVEAQTGETLSKGAIFRQMDTEFAGQVYPDPNDRSGLGSIRVKPGAFSPIDSPHQVWRTTQTNTLGQKDPAPGVQRHPPARPGSSEYS